jgi:hypothetical protein
MLAMLSTVCNTTEQASVPSWSSCGQLRAMMGGYMSRRLKRTWQSAHCQLGGEDRIPPRAHQAASSDPAAIPSGPEVHVEPRLPLQLLQCHWSCIVKRESGRGDGHRSPPPATERQTTACLPAVFTCAKLVAILLLVSRRPESQMLTAQPLHYSAASASPHMLNSFTIPAIDI